MFDRKVNFRKTTASHCVFALTLGTLLCIASSSLLYAEDDTCPPLVDPALDAVVWDSSAYSFDAEAHRVGLHLFSFMATEDRDADGTGDAVRYIDEVRPTAIRWTVEWDRYESGGNVEQNWSSHRPFFEALARNRVRLLVQIWVKEALWQGDGAPLRDWLLGRAGTMWAKPKWDCNYPEDTTASYGDFVLDLYAALVSAYEQGGADPGLISFEAWNEVDIMWGLSGDAINYRDQWCLLERADSAKFSGGTSRFLALHAVLDEVAPDMIWLSSGIGSTWGLHYETPPPGYPGITDPEDACAEFPPDPLDISPWILEAAANESIRELDIHFYMNNTSYGQGTATAILKGVRQALEVWDAARGYLGLAPLPFTLGETGVASKEGSVPDAAQAAELRKAHLQLIETYGDRYRGAVLLAGYPCNYRKGWWEATYTDDDINQSCSP